MPLMRSGRGQKMSRQDSGCDTAQNYPLPLSFTAQKGLLALHQGLEQIDERHFPVQQGVANGNRGLPRQHLDHLDVRLLQKVRIAALIEQQAHAPLVIGQRKRKEGAIVAGFKVLT